MYCNNMYIDTSLRTSIFTSVLDFLHQNKSHTLSNSYLTNTPTMFIKKDLRKVPEIFDDEKDEKEALKLQRRAAEFEGSIDILALSINVEKLKNLRVLNLYGNHLTTLEDIGYLDETPVEEINLGGNDLDSLPLEFGRILTLSSLWLDDNNFEKFPICICQLYGLRELRFSGNKLDLTDLPASVSSLQSLETLALDNNLIVDIPDVLWTIAGLRNLWLRQNRLTSLPPGVFRLSRTLEILSISSNFIESFPSDSGGETNTDWAAMRRLSQLYANGNKLTLVPESLAFNESLTVVNIANNRIGRLPGPWSAGAMDKANLINGVLNLPKPSQWDGSKVESGSMEVCEQQLKVYIIGNPVMASLE